MGAFQGKEEATGAAKASAAFKREKPPKVERRAKGYYIKGDLDGYAKCRIRPSAGQVQKTMLDADLFVAVLECLEDDGKIDKNEMTTKILPKLADGRIGRGPELTCNERWTIRYALGEFEWDFDARVELLSAMHAMDVLDLADHKVVGEEMKSLMFGPPLQSLQEPSAKKATKGAAGGGDFVAVDGMNLDRQMLLAAAEGSQANGVVDAVGAIAIFQAAADESNVLTRCERWTARFILSSYAFTDAAFNFLKEALQKLERDDSLGTI